MRRAVSARSIDFYDASRSTSEFKAEMSIRKSMSRIGDRNISDADESFCARLSIIHDVPNVHDGSHYGITIEKIGVIGFAKEPMIAGISIRSAKNRKIDAFIIRIERDRSCSARSLLIPSDGIEIRHRIDDCRNDWCKVERSVSIEFPSIGVSGIILIIHKRPTPKPRISDEILESFSERSVVRLDVRHRLSALIVIENIEDYIKRQRNGRGPRSRERQADAKVLLRDRRKFRALEVHATVPAVGRRVDGRERLRGGTEIIVRVELERDGAIGLHRFVRVQRDLPEFELSTDIIDLRPPFRIERCGAGELIKSFCAAVRPSCDKARSIDADMLLYVFRGGNRRRGPRT